MAKNLLKAAPPKKRRVITPRGLDAKYLGEEPTWEGQEFLNEDELQSRIGKAYNWYNYFYEAKEGRKWLIEYMTEQQFSKSAQSMIGRVPDSKLNSTMCNTARMISMGLDAPQYLRDKLDNYLASCVKQSVEAVEAEKKIAAVTVTVIVNPADRLIGDIEDMLDRNEYPESFYSWLKEKNIKPQQARAVADYYRPILNELIEAQTTKDVDLKYAYRHLTKKQLKERTSTYESLVNDCESLVTNNRKSVVRKPRKKKPKSADKIVSKIKFQKEDTNLKIVSIDPSKLVGASELWVFNTKYNVLAHYIAGEGGLSMKGTTLQNINDKSRQKKLRKPADVLSGITDSTSKAAERTFNGLKTKETQPNGRINEFTIILRAIK